MESLFNKLIKLSFWNTSAAGINFLTNLLIVSIFGLEVFGELAYLSSLSALMGLVFLFIPSNYSIIHYQDNPKFKYLLSAFYLMASFLLFGLSAFLYSKPGLPYWLFSLYAWAFSMQSYFDISLQAENKLQRYYIILFVVALSKACLIGGYYFLGNSYDLFTLILLITLSQLLVILILLLRRFRLFYDSISYIPEVIRLILSERKLFRKYYLSLGLNRLNVNLIILIFEPWVGKEILGTYSLLMKVYLFITGLVRSLESLFINKISNALYKKSFKSKLWVIGILSQILYLAVGLLYMNYLTGKNYIIFLLLFSSTMYLYLYYIKARADLLIQYKNKEIILSNMVFLAMVFISFVLFRLLNINQGLTFMVVTFLFALVSQMTYLILAEKKNLPLTKKQ